MAMQNANPVRTQIRQEIIEALADGQPRTAEQLYGLCPSANDASEISKVAYELRRSGLIDHGDKAKNSMNMEVNTYLRATTNAYLDAAKPIPVERKIKRTAKAPKPAASNPYTNFTISKPQEAAPRVTRDLPQHLQSTAPIAAQEAVMSQEPTPYIVNPPFAPKPEDIDSELVDALLAKMVPLPQADDDDDVLDTAAANMGKLVAAMASADVGEITAALGKETPKKVCQCIKLNALPPLPPGFLYGGIRVFIESENDVGRLTLSTVDEGGGPFITLKARGNLSFDEKGLVAIGQVADALIRLHEAQES